MHGSTYNITYLVNYVVSRVKNILNHFFNVMYILCTPSTYKINVENFKIYVHIFVFKILFYQTRINFFFINNENIFFLMFSLVERFKKLFNPSYGKNHTVAHYVPSGAATKKL